jgi:hypothetical protein
MLVCVEGVACGKVRHADEFAAAAHAVIMARKEMTGQAVNVYWCDACQAYHWGHAFQNDSRRARARRKNKAKRRSVQREAARA